MLCRGKDSKFQVPSFKFQSSKVVGVDPDQRLFYELPNYKLPNYKLPRRPAEAAAAQQVQVQMEDGLAGVGSDVIHGAVALLDAALTRDPGRDQMGVADDFRILDRRIPDVDDVALGHDENVGRRLRMNILKRENFVVFVHFARRALAGYDVAE
jgi:hypothetical protein